jgi:hypothetical protein
MLLLFAIAFCYSGCDSATDSKSVSVNPPGLLKPYDGDSNVSRATTFEWSGEATTIQIDINPNFNTPKFTYAVTGNAFTITTPLEAHSVYYWKAGKTVGSTTYWSENSYRFKTGAN